MAKLRSEAEFSAQVQQVLRADPLLDVFPMETAIDDGLTDIGIIYRPTGQMTFLELKVGAIQGSEVSFRTLQGSQINFMAERSMTPGVGSFLLIEHPKGLMLIPARYDADWRRAVSARKCALESPLTRPVEWSTLALAVRPPLGLAAPAKAH